jgi:hypothetical protein
MLAHDAAKSTTRFFVLGKMNEWHDVTTAEAAGRVAQTTALGDVNWYRVARQALAAVEWTLNESKWAVVFYMVSNSISPYSSAGKQPSL